ncbi:MAG: TIGR03086 family metal-binding protein [Pseudonocardia sp.]|nr:TIGR03086 family metal-binding protein [Pseudonocardia sp.]
MPILDDYLGAGDGFDRIVTSLRPDQWDDPSACTEWTARDVLGHVVWGQEMVAHLAPGLTHDSQAGAPGAPHPGQLIIDSPVERWRSARASATATLTPDALDRIVTLRAFGQVPLATFLQALTVDFLAHAWDIGHPAGLDVRLDPALVDRALVWSRQHDLRAPGGLGPEQPAPAGADEQTRLLAFLGRRPVPVSTHG